VFFALQGSKTDGHQFLEEVKLAGAAFAVVSANRELPPFGEFLEPVPDVLGALQALAARHRRTLDARVLGLTGSNGKTTTKDLLGAALSTRFHTFVTPGNLNNHIGLPLCILQIEKDVECIVIELGDNRPGDIAELCEIAQPTAGLITNIGQDHLEGYGSLESNAHTKLELFNYVNQTNGMIFKNGSDPWLADFPSKDTIEYGLPESALWAEVLSSKPGQLAVRLCTPTGAFRVNSKFTGAYNAENLVAAATVALHWGVPVADLVRAFEGFVPQNQRSQLIELPGLRIISDCYNANPSSMRAALTSLMSSEPDSLALFLGEMRELGDRSKELHRELAPLVRELAPSVVVGVGRGMLPLLEALTGINCHYYATAEAAAEDAHDLIQGCMLVFVKGSRSMRMEHIINQLQMQR
jgi:UDP-N-acetylmuramoyl-tripeptide--D-alanyl-D-alanine ligase